MIPICNSANHQDHMFSEPVQIYLQVEIFIICLSWYELEKLCQVKGPHLRNYCSMLLDLLGREHFASTKDYSGCYFSYSNYESKNNNHIQEAMINDMYASNFNATSIIQNAPMYFHILHGNKLSCCWTIDKAELMTLSMLVIRDEECCWAYSAIGWRQ